MHECMNSHIDCILIYHFILFLISWFSNELNYIDEEEDVVILEKKSYTINKLELKLIKFDYITCHVSYGRPVAVFVINSKVLVIDYTMMTLSTQFISLLQPRIIRSNKSYMTPNTWQLTQTQYLNNIRDKPKFRVW